MRDLRVAFESEKVSFGDAILVLQKVQRWENSKGPIFHSHCYYELFLVRQGPLVIDIKDGPRISAETGKILILQPNVLHKTNASDCNVEIISLGIEIIKTQSANRFYSYFRSVLEKNARVPLLADKAWFRKCLNYFSAPARDTIQQLCHRKMETCEILVGLFDALGKEHVRYREVDTTSFDIALESLVYTSSVTLREMAEKLGYSERQLYRIIKARYGKSLREIRKGFK